MLPVVAFAPGQQYQAAVWGETRLGSEEAMTWRK